MLHTMFHHNWSTGSGEEDFWDQTPIEGTSVVLSLLEGEMSRIGYQNDQKYPNPLNR